MAALSQLILPTTSNMNDVNCVALLHLNGTNGDRTTPDSSRGAGVNGGLTTDFSASSSIDTAQSKFGVSSVRIPGPAGAFNYMAYTAVGTTHTFGTGDFTIDFWVRYNTLPAGTGSVLADFRPFATDPLSLLIYHPGTNNFAAYVGGSVNAVVITGSVTVSTGTWYHVALTRASGSTKLFINGTQDGSTYSDSNDYAGPGASRPIFGVNSKSGTSNQFDGWLDEIRVSKGVARWTSNFTPPSSPYF
jgi:hypothetical protein